MKTEQRSTDEVDALFRALSNAEMVEMIEDRYHGRLRRHVPEIISLATKVERVHQEDSLSPKGLSAYLIQMWASLEPHLMREEYMLFPAIKKGNYFTAKMPIRLMETEHHEQYEILKTIEDFKEKYPLPAHACRTWRALFEGLDTFSKELSEHLYIEDNVLFPRVLKELG